MFRFYVSSENIHENFVELEKEDINHVKNVLRMKAGEHILVCDMQGVDYECILSEITDACVRADIKCSMKNEAELPADIMLFQGMPKKDKMELIIQKAVELGATRIVPVMTRYCVTKLDSKKEEKVISRWNTIARSAAKQSQRGIIPQVTPVMKFADAVKEASKCDLAVVAYEKAKGMEYSKKILGDVKGKKNIAVFIGPEGGFSEEEINAAFESGVTAVSLGHRILRTETAGLTILSIIMFGLEEDKEGGQEA